VLAIAPDRIALYAYAHVTWVAKQQRGFERGDLPEPAQRAAIQLAALRRLLRAGYVHVGMDHFARPADELARALAGRTLRRNFMGYTTRAGVALVGLGPSAISELEGSYAQSRRELETWQAALAAGDLATARGHALTQDDRERHWIVAGIMCHGEVSAAAFRLRFGARFGERFAAELAALGPLVDDGLVEVASDGSLRATALGRLAVRQIAMAFDAYLPAQRAAPGPLFSQTV
jgi:oxygen-independent coproporphyrinogen-3 oxidase